LIEKRPAAENGVIFSEARGKPRALLIPPKSLISMSEAGGERKSPA